jgi:LAO/AO transport system kinase
MNEPSSLLSEVAAFKPRAVARAISILEDDLPGASDLRDAVEEKNPRSVLIGITGPAGVGKSSLVSCLLTCIKRRVKRVGVLAIDPTSERTGGALLGDRIRMMQHATDERVTIRSLATRGMVGGLTRKTLVAGQILSLAGCDPILVETTGVGQVDTAIARFADLVTVVLCPGCGDQIQTMKAGLLEIADLVVVNKSDLAGAAQLHSWLRAELSGTRTALYSVSASQATGVAELEADLAAREAWVRQTGSWRMGRSSLRDSAFVDRVLLHLRPYVEKMISQATAPVTSPVALAQSIINDCTRPGRVDGRTAKQSFGTGNDAASRNSESTENR